MRRPGQVSVDGGHRPADPGGTNERFDRAGLRAADIIVYPDNLAIFDRLADGDADVMITDASETRTKSFR